MEGRLFTLCLPEDYRKIFAWGIEIADGENTEAITYRRDPDGGHPVFSLHASAAAARRLFARICPLTVVWEDDFYAELDELIERHPPGGPDEAAEAAHLQS